jgi:hypothetical protein
MNLRQKAFNTTLTVFKSRENHLKLRLRMECPYEELVRVTMTEIRVKFFQEMEDWLNSLDLKKYNEILKTCEDPELVWKKLVLSKSIKILEAHEEEISKLMNPEDSKTFDELFKYLHSWYRKKPQELGGEEDRKPQSIERKPQEEDKNQTIEE